MTNENIQEQINEINRKLDLVLEEISAQRETRQSLEDLSEDINRIGKEVFKTAVTELDRAGIEVDGEAVKQLLLKVVMNVDTLSEMFELMESASDFIKDVTPILHQVGLDGIKLMYEFEQKGYFDFMSESMKIMDNIVTHFSKEDVRLLADNIVTILETVKSLTQPEMLKAINNGIVVYRSIEVDKVEDITLWKAMKEMNSKEMRKGLGFMITFLKNIAREAEKAKQIN